METMIYNKTMKGEMKMARCGSCEYKKKVRSTTFYRCDKYDTILPTNPAMQCVECIRSHDQNKPKQKSAKKDFIQVK